MWTYQNVSCLMHYGVKGMKWGVRKKRFSSGSKHGTIGLQFFAKRPSEFKGLRLPIKEYAHVMSEVATHATKEQRQKASFKKAIGNHIYTVANNFDGTFQIIDKVPLAENRWEKR